jgi:predicted transcriptional regulator
LSDPSDPDDDLPEDSKLYLKRVTVGYIDYLFDTALKRNPPKMPAESERAIKAMAQFVAIMRARSRQDKETLEFAKARVEIPTRLVTQMVKLSIFLAIILERASIDDEVLRVVRKVVFDTVDSVELDIIKLIHDSDHSGLSCRQLHTELDLSEKAVLQRLQSLRFFGAVRKRGENNNSGQRGRNVHIWELTDIVDAVYKTSSNHQPQAIRASRPKPKRGKDVTPRRRTTVTPRKK